VICQERVAFGRCGSNPAARFADESVVGRGVPAVATCGGIFMKCSSGIPGIIVAGLAAGLVLVLGAGRAWADEPLPPRTDTPSDWIAVVEPLYGPCEPRALSPCVPPPPCHPAEPPHPYDLIGVGGEPSCGPIYRGPCEPRAGSHSAGLLPLRRIYDRLFDWFYTPK